MKVGKWNYTGFAYLAGLIIDSGAKKATQYISPTEVAKATRRGKARKSDRTVEILFTIGRPNYKEREFIKKCKKTGEPFPVKKIQVRFPTKSR